MTLMIPSDITSMSSEETPLLAPDNVASRDAVYQRFSPRTKKAIVAMVSGCGLIPCKYVTSYV